ncbi:MAG: acyl-CoA dehydrogenase family protein [Spirochaetia bacterium]|nr:acyl-CoA dehydrogenase family protein [Spirochaetia bacterium]
MIQSNYYQDNDDLKQHVEELIDWNEIVELYEGGFADAEEYKRTKNPKLELAPSTVEEAKQFYQEIFNSVGEVSGMYVSQVAQDIDKEGLRFEDGRVIHPQKMVDVVHKYQEAGLAPVGFKRKYGGLGLPNTAKAIAAELMYRSDTSVTIVIGSMGLAGILERYASPEMREKWIPKIVDGHYCVTMGLSEPDYGSDLPEVKTRAVKNGNQWLLTGTKRFQTVACGLNGEPALTLALARTGAPDSGARGLSFFIVESKDYQITGIEKKLGIKASATCEVAYENSPGELVGQEGYGLVKYVIGMLNGARLTVSSQGTGIATAALAEAKKYASERIQFGKPIDQIPAVRRMLRRMEREIAAMRCLMIEAAYSVDKYQWPSERPAGTGSAAPDAVRFWEKVANVLTPISKYFNSETCNDLVDTALQVLGGAGYSEEYDVARLYRDARITNIYDGTTQIQVNAAIGGISAGMAPTGVFRQYIDALDKASGQNPAVAKIRSVFDRVVETWKAVPERTRKEELSFEVVESAARLTASLLMERALARSTAGHKEKRLAWNREYHADSLAVLSANLVRLENA